MTDGDMSGSGIERTDITPNGNPVYEWTDDDGFIVAIPEDDEIYIPVIKSGENTRMKDLVSAVVDELGNNSIVFANVINAELKASLDNFKEEQEFAENYGEYVTVLRGKWCPERDTNRRADR